MKANGVKFYHVLYYFVFYSFIGWFIETVYMSLRAGEFVKRGFLNGPFCPVYGFGALIIIFLLNSLKDRMELFITGSILLTTILEYITGLAMKIAFNRTWWDYSDEPFNIHGFICLKSSIMWGILSVILICFIHPHINHMISRIPACFRKVASYALILYFITDLAVTVSVIKGIDVNLNQLIWIRP